MQSRRNPSRKTLTRSQTNQSRKRGVGSRKTLTRSQTNQSRKRGVVSRKTLTNAQMYHTPAGFQEGGNIFKSIGKFLKKSKILSTIGSIAAPLVSILPIPGAPVAGTVVAAASKAAKQAGLGNKKVKSITPLSLIHI